MLQKSQVTRLIDIQQQDLPLIPQISPTEGIALNPSNALVYLVGYADGLRQAYKVLATLRRNVLDATDSLEDSDPEIGQRIDSDWL